MGKKAMAAFPIEIYPQQSFMMNPRLFLPFYFRFSKNGHEVLPKKKHFKNMMMKMKMMMTMKMMMVMMMMMLMLLLSSLLLLLLMTMMTMMMTMMMMIL